MNIIEVSPLVPHLDRGTLSFFSSRHIKQNSIVEVPLRGKTVAAFVEAVREVQQAKMELRSSRFTLKRVKRVVSKYPLPQALTNGLGADATFFATTIGTLLTRYIPKHAQSHLSNKQWDFATRQRQPHRIIGTVDSERFLQYRSIIRESFSKKESVVIVVPTVADGKAVRADVSRGIEPYILTLNSEERTSAIKQTLQKLAREDHPCVLITTPAFLLCLPKQTGVIIIERENSGAYRTRERPLVDLHRLSITIADALCIPVIRGDIVLRLSTYEMLAAQNAPHGVEHIVRMQIPAIPTEYVDMTRSKTESKPSEALFSVFSPALQNAVEETCGAGGVTALLSGRKGLAPYTICGDCGTLLCCHNCGAPLSLHKTKDSQRLYLCRRCGNQFDPSVNCARCNSWKLVPLGIGSERVEEEVREKFPDAAVFRVDSESVRDRTDVEKTIKRFFDTPGSILIGTELIIPYISRPVDCVGVVSLDFLSALPDYRANERVMSLISRLRSHASAHCVIQTRQYRAFAFRDAAYGDVAHFVSEELSLRKRFSYPPYSIFIKITISGRQQQIQSDMDSLQQKLADRNFTVFPAFLKRGSSVTLSGLLRLSNDEWPNSDLMPILKELPPSVTIHVEPESIL